MAYGARLESVLGESPRGFESPILRRFCAKRRFERCRMDQVVTPRESQALVNLVEVLKPLKVLEFGSWQGRSALSFMAEMKRLSLDGEITCVDTWLGSPEHWDPTNDHPE